MDGLQQLLGEFQVLGIEPAIQQVQGVDVVDQLDLRPGGAVEFAASGALGFKDSEPVASINVEWWTVPTCAANRRASALAGQISALLIRPSAALMRPR